MVQKCIMGSSGGGGNAEKSGTISSWSVGGVVNHVTGVGYTPTVVSLLYSTTNAILTATYDGINSYSKDMNRQASDTSVQTDRCIITPTSDGFDFTFSASAASLWQGDVSWVCK